MHFGEEFRVEHGGRCGLLRSLVSRKLGQHLIALRRDPRGAQQWLQRCIQTRLPIDQGAVAVEGQDLEIGEFHKLMLPRPSSMTSPLTNTWRCASTRRRNDERRPVYSP